MKEKYELWNDIQILSRDDGVIHRFLQFIEHHPSEVDREQILMMMVLVLSECHRKAQVKILELYTLYGDPGAIVPTGIIKA